MNKEIANYPEDIFDDVEGLEEDETDSFEFSGDITAVPAQHLCDIVIAFQYLGLAKDHAIDCMRELSRRRDEGDSFSFEQYIKAELASLPKIEQFSIGKLMAK